MAFPLNFRKLERRARLGMGAFTVIMVCGLVAFNTGLISTELQYKADAWYAQSGDGAMLVTREYADEAQCRKEADPSLQCRSGKAMQEAQRPSHG